MDSFRLVAAFTEIVNLLQFQVDRGEVDVGKPELPARSLNTSVLLVLHDLFTLIDPVSWSRLLPVQP